MLKKKKQSNLYKMLKVFIQKITVFFLSDAVGYCGEALHG